jgi:uncharacterized protein
MNVSLLLAAGMLAGIFNAIAGGGTLITFPILVLLGINAITANATSTVALILGILGSIWGYRQQLPSTAPWLRAFLLPSILGGLLGGVLLTCTPNRVFDFLVPYLILFATLLFVARNFFVRHLVTGMREIGQPHKFTIFLQFLISLYGGYFGAGIGILMLASLSMMGLHSIVQMNALKTILGGTINLVAALYFIWKGLVDWPIVFVLAIGAIPGYYIGAVLTQRIPATLVRHLIVVIGLLLAAATFVQQIRGHLSW